MALTESQIKVIIAAELQKGGFDKADKAAKNLTKTFQKLGATIGVALSARAFINFAKAGAVAFANEEKAVKQLTNSLANLGFAFSVPSIERYLESTEKATMVTKEELRPAMVQLISTTLSAQKSMALLNTALDISAATGSDVGQVTTALSRAYNGNYTAIAKLSRGYTAAQLEAAGFDQTVELLNNRFSGSATAATDSYSFKLAQLKKAVGDAQKEIGSGLIKGLEQLGSGDYNEGLQDLVDFGNAIGKSFGYAAGAVNTVKQAFDLITLRPVRDITAELLGKAEDQRRAGTKTPTQLELVQTAIQKRKEKALRDAERRDREKLNKLAEKERKAREAALKKEQQLKRAGSIFDMENIQIVAALQGQIDGEQRLRLVALLALNNGIAEAAEKAASAVVALNAPALANLGVIVRTGDTIETVIGKLINAQAKVALVDLGISNIPKAKNPFEAWDKVFKDIIFNLDTIAEKLKKMPSVSANAQTGITTAPSTTAPAPSFFDRNAPTPIFPAQPSIGEGPGKPYLQNLSPDLQDIFAGLGINSKTLFDLQIGAENDSPMVIVNVQGSVTTQGDLVEAITDSLYKYQKSGKSILVGSVQL